MVKTLIIIPAQMRTARLPDKPMVDIHGSPMIVHCWRRAMRAEAGRVVVATDAEIIAETIRAHGGEAVMTRQNHISGSDRVFEAVSKIDPEFEADIVVNLQGDLPALEPHLITKCLAPLTNPATHIATVAAEIKQVHERTAEQVVKVVGTTQGAGSDNILRALYFSRSPVPHGDGPLYRHIGIYAYRRTALERFVSLKPSPLELREKLEQLRAIEGGMRIDVAIVDTIPLGVDTPADLERAREILASEA